MFTEERLRRERFNSNGSPVLASSWGKLRRGLRCEATRDAQSATDAGTGVVAGCVPRVGYWAMQHRAVSARLLAFILD